MVVAVTAMLFCWPTGLPFELEAAPMAIAATAPTPSRIQPVWPICASLTPAGLPAGSGPTLSAAKAADASKVVDKATAIRVRMFPLRYSIFFATIHKSAIGTMLRDGPARKCSAAPPLCKMSSKPVPVVFAPHSRPPVSDQLYTEYPAHAGTILVRPAGMMAGIAADQGALVETKPMRVAGA